MNEQQNKTLLMIGFGVTGKDGGFYNESGDRLDFRTVAALMTRGLVQYHTTGGAPVVGVLELTTIGEEMFDELVEKNRTSTRAAPGRNRFF